MSARFGVSVQVLPVCETGSACGVAQIRRFGGKASASDRATMLEPGSTPRLTRLSPEGELVAGERIDTAAMAAGTPVEIAF